jgi:hypothetical protein
MDMKAFSGMGLETHTQTWSNIRMHLALGAERLNTCVHTAVCKPVPRFAQIQPRGVRQEESAHAQKRCRHHHKLAACILLRIAAMHAAVIRDAYMLRIAAWNCCVWPQDVPGRSDPRYMAAGVDHPLKLARRGLSTADKVHNHGASRQCRRYQTCPQTSKQRQGAGEN